MSNKAIRALLETRLKTWADAQSPALPIAFENVPFTPPQDKTYLRAFLLPANTDSKDLKGDHRLYAGIFQVTIVVPSGAGTGAAGTIAAALGVLFPVNLRLTSTLTVQMLSPMSESKAIEEPDALAIPVTARYRTDVI